jgi:hypothetical protein
MGGIGLIYIVLRGQFLNLGGIRYIFGVGWSMELTKCVTNWPILKCRVPLRGNKLP